MDKFDLVYRFTRLWEKGTSSHPKDPGGLTHNGITYGFFMGLMNDPNFRDDLDINQDGVVDGDDLVALSDEHCRIIYENTFWKWVKGPDLPLYAALCTFDMAVHSGPKPAIKMLQRALHVEVDGLIGPKTLREANKLSVDQLYAVAEDYLNLRMQFLRGIGNDAMIAGWTNRIESKDPRKPGLRAYLKELKDNGLA